MSVNIAVVDAMLLFAAMLLMPLRHCRFSHAAAAATMLR